MTSTLALPLGGAIFCGREQVPNKWKRVLFPLNVFVHPLLGLPGQEHQPGKGRKTNKGSVKSDFENQEGVNLDALQHCPAQQLGSWPKLESAQRQCLSNTSMMQEYTQNSKSLWVLQLLCQFSKILINGYKK